MYIAKIKITLRSSILDPQGKTVEHSLKSLGYDKIEGTRVGKYIEMKINTDSKEEAESIADKACEKLLSNPVMEDYEFEISKDGEN